MAPPMAPESGADDRSSHVHRQVIGWLGASLPPAVYAFDRWRPTNGLPADLLTSISAYHYTAGVTVFAGVLAALAVYLLTYRGYGNAWQSRDRTAAMVAGTAAALVALFPTNHPSAQPVWWGDIIGRVHDGAAAALFGAFIYFALVLFPKTAPGAPQVTPDKRWRNRLYRACALGMMGCVGWIVVAKQTGASIFWPEAIALEIFAVSWLVKGRTDESLGAAAAAVRRFVRGVTSRAAGSRTR